MLGCDCKYVELLDGVEVSKKIRYLLTKDLEFNPNYWFDDYQRAGDRFNKPNTDSIQLAAWRKLKDFELSDQITITNGSYPTALKLFDRVPFHVATSEYENIFIVISCKKNIDRVRWLINYYKSNINDRDLLLFAIGGSDHSSIEDGAILLLNCGDLYENLPEKVYKAIVFCVKYLKFKRLIKVDDDVFINFKRFYEIVDADFVHCYYGRKNPANVGDKLNTKYHYGKVSENHRYHNKEFPLPDNIQWNSGGVYILNHTAAAAISDFFDYEWIESHLYEDVMVYTILKMASIVPTHHENEKHSFLTWMVRDVEDVFESDLKTIRCDFKFNNVVSIHCGSSKIKHINNSVISECFRNLNKLSNYESEQL